MKTKTTKTATCTSECPSVLSGALGRVIKVGEQFQVVREFFRNGEYHVTCKSEGLVFSAPSVFFDID